MFLWGRDNRLGRKKKYKTKGVEGSGSVGG